jgi:hypothetical protein
MRYIWILLFLISCQSDPVSVIPPSTKPVVYNPKTFKKDLSGRDVYIQLWRGEYKIYFERFGWFEGTYRGDEWGYGHIVMDDQGCGSEGQYYYQEYGDTLRLMSSEFCDRHIYLTGDYTRTAGFPVQPNESSFIRSRDDSLRSWGGS